MLVRVGILNLGLSDHHSRRVTALTVVRDVSARTEGLEILGDAGRLVMLRWTLVTNILCLKQSSLPFSIVAGLFSGLHALS